MRPNLIADGSRVGIGWLSWYQTTPNQNTWIRMRIFPHQLFQHPSSGVKLVLQSAVSNDRSKRGLSPTQNIDFEWFFRAREESAEFAWNKSFFFYLTKNRILIALSVFSLESLSLLKNIINIFDICKQVYFKINFIYTASVNIHLFVLILKKIFKILRVIFFFSI